MSFYRDTPEYQALHPSTKDLLDQFEYEHLPEPLRSISKLFCDLALDLVLRLSKTRYGGELSTGLRKLLEAKDCAVRAARGVDL